MVSLLTTRRRRPEALAGLDDLARSGDVRVGAAGVGARPIEVIPTGVVALDAVLPGGGFPCGYVTELAGPPSCGKLGLAARALAGALDAGERAALVDATGVFFPLAPGLVRALARLLVCRVPTAADGLAAAELLAAGGVALVVVDLAAARFALAGAARAALVRLARAAREGRSAVVAVTEPPAGAEGLLGTFAALRLRATAARCRVRDGRIESAVRVVKSRFGPAEPR
jgi:hypothetical protein